MKSQTILPECSHHHQYFNETIAKLYFEVLLAWPRYGMATSDTSAKLVPKCYIYVLSLLSTCARIIFGLSKCVRVRLSLYAKLYHICLELLKYC